MKFLTQGIVFSEIPDEITLELGITNCPFNCEGCHSPFLQSDIGEILDENVIHKLINKNRGISCILFSGGFPKEVEELCFIVKNNYPNIKTAWYTGLSEIPNINLDYFDYIKIGAYIKDLGGLKSPKTNQRLYKIKDKKLEDITYKFWK